MIGGCVLQQFIAANRAEIIARWNAHAATRLTPPLAGGEINNGIPVFLDQLENRLRFGPSSGGEIVHSAITHGHALHRQGYTVSQVVHYYGDVCQAITGLAVDHDATFTTDDVRTLNQSLDDAIAGAVTEYGGERHQPDLGAEPRRGSEHLGFLAHELRNLTNTALVAFEVLKTGNVGVAGSTGSVLHRSLLGITALVGRSLAEVRLTHGVHDLAILQVSEFIEELAAAATLEANARNIRLVVLGVEDGVVIEADRQILAAVVANLLQNAFKFTRPGTTVTLRVGASPERVRIEVEDECGGLPSGNVHELFRPFEQRSADRTGLGLGLAFSRWGAEANHGRISTRNLPDKGCVFAVDLPRFYRTGST
jgi:signal transduction histidine kinase